MVIEGGIVQEIDDLAVIGRAEVLSVRRQFGEHHGDKPLLGACDVEFRIASWLPCRRGGPGLRSRRGYGGWSARRKPAAASRSARARRTSDA